MLFFHDSFRLMRMKIYGFCIFQEVETDQFYKFFLPELKREGYEGIFSPKSRAKEGGHINNYFIGYTPGPFPSDLFLCSISRQGGNSSLCISKENLHFLPLA